MNELIKSKVAEYIGDSVVFNEESYLSAEVLTYWLFCRKIFNCIETKPFYDPSDIIGADDFFQQFEQATSSVAPEADVPAFWFKYHYDQYRGYFQAYVGRIEYQKSALNTSLQPGRGFGRFYTPKRFDPKGEYYLSSLDKENSIAFDTTYTLLNKLVDLCQHPNWVQLTEEAEQLRVACYQHMKLIHLEQLAKEAQEKENG